MEPVNGSWFVYRKPRNYRRLRKLLAPTVFLSNGKSGQKRNKG
jgi:hypothetical protein